MNDQLLTINQVAEKLGKNAQVVRRWVRDGELPATKYGPIWMVRESDLERYGPKLAARKGRPRKDSNEVV